MRKAFPCHDIMIYSSAEVEGKLGGDITLDCDQPDHTGELILQWRFDGIPDVPIFIRYNGYPPHIDNEFADRLEPVEQMGIQISDLRTSDSGWYKCEVILLDDPSPVNATRVHLTVDCKSAVRHIFRLRQKGRHFVCDTCKYHFSEWKFLCFDWHFTEIPSGNHVTIS